MSTLKIIETLAKKIDRPLNLMEVCGTHTVAIFKSGIKALLPNNIKLISGPGCPVCVTPVEDIDRAIAYSLLDDTIVVTFGDMLRVPGSKQSLFEVKADGAKVEIVYSPSDCLRICERNPDKRVVFFSAGFETTAPLSAATIHEAEIRGIKNLLLYSVHKLVPPALDLLMRSEEVRIDGFILPGHVSAVIGSEPYRFLPEQFKVPCVITGFSGEDILAGLSMLLRQIYEQDPQVQIQYRSVVRPGGNPQAKGFIDKYYKPTDSYWRGIGLLPNSGLKLKDEWYHRDSERLIPLEVTSMPEPKGCQCGLVLRGVKTPPECLLFAKTCTPERPIGACMVSSEGSCSAYYKYSNQT